MSSLFGPATCGYFFFKASITTRASSTLSVVCVRNASFASAGSVSASTSATSSTSTIACGASPIVPITSSCPSWPISTMVYPSLANFTASMWTFVTSGQVASMARRLRVRDASRMAGDTPCAL